MCKSRPGHRREAKTNETGEEGREIARGGERPSRSNCQKNTSWARDAHFPSSSPFQLLPLRRGHGANGGDRNARQRGIRGIEVAKGQNSVARRRRRRQLIQTGHTFISPSTLSALSLASFAPSSTYTFDIRRRNFP